MHAPLLNSFFSILCSWKSLKCVIDYIQDTLSMSHEIGTVPAITQTSLKYIYRERIIHHRYAYESINAQSFGEAAHATRLKEKIYNKIPGLCASKSGIQVNLSWQALFEACAWSDGENDRGINKAAKIVRKDLPGSDGIFDGDVSEKRQSLSVPNSLVKLIIMILEVGESSRELSAGLQVSANHYQLISLNSEKQRHRKGTQKFRYSKNNKPHLPVLISLMVHSKTGKRRLVVRLPADGA